MKDFVTSGSPKTMERGASGLGSVGEVSEGARQAQIDGVDEGTMDERRSPMGM